MSTNSPDSHKISLKIIEAIKQHPVLYISEVKGNSIKLQEFRQKVWKRISNELGLDASWVKLKWKNLRDTYCRILKYKKKSQKGTKRKRWIFEESLSFLKFPFEEDYQPQTVELTEEYINDINTETISSDDLLEQLEESQEDDDYSEYLEILENDISSEGMSKVLEQNDISPNTECKTNQITQNIEVDKFTKQIHSKFRKIKPKKRKLENSDNNTSDKLHSILINNETTVPLLKKSTLIEKQTPTEIVLKRKTYNYNDSIDDFFKNIAQNVKKLPLKVQADIKMDICKIVSEAEINYLKNNTLQNVQKYTNMPGMLQKLLLVPCHMIDNQLKTD